MRVHVINLNIWCGYSKDCLNACADPEGGGWGEGVRTPPFLKKHKNIVFLTYSGPDPLKNHKATEPEFNVGPSSARQ